MEMNQTKVKTMDELPKVPFQRILSYLSLRDLLQCKAVSRGWYHQINCRKVKSLCCSELPSGLIWEKNRWVNGSFDQNFISSTQLQLFFVKLGPTILSELKRLRLCEIRLVAKNTPASLQFLNSFGSLEELDIIRFGQRSNPKIEIDLNLPMLRSIHLENVNGVQKLALDAPRLRRVKHWDPVNLDFAHGESIEKLLIYDLDFTEVKNLKNLKELHIRRFSQIDPTLLSSLEQLKEFHLHEGDLTQISQLFEQKREYGRTDLKIYRFGCLLDGPEDPLVTRFQNYDDEELFVHLAENPTRLADEIPFFTYLYYGKIRSVTPTMAINLLKRFTDLRTITVSRPVQDTKHFLELLKNLNNIAMLRIHRYQPQELFDSLPELCAIQELYIDSEPLDLHFLFRLKHLVKLDLDFASIGFKAIRKILEFPFLSEFEFWLFNNWIQMEIDAPKRYTATVGNETAEFADSNAAIQFLTDTIRREDIE